jgi:hypothetical protein
MDCGRELHAFTKAGGPTAHLKCSMWLACCAGCRESRADYEFAAVASVPSHTLILLLPFLLDPFTTPLLSSNQPQRKIAH